MNNSHWLNCQSLLRSFCLISEVGGASEARKRQTLNANWATKHRRVDSESTLRRTMNAALVSQWGTLWSCHECVWALSQAGTRPVRCIPGRQNNNPPTRWRVQRSAAVVGGEASIVLPTESPTIVDNPNHTHKPKTVRYHTNILMI